MNTEPKRLHPIAMIFMFYKFIKAGLFPLIAVVTIFITDVPPAYRWVIWVAVGLLLFIIVFLPSIISWLRYQYWVDEGELRIKEGLLFRKNHYIRKERVQSVNRSATLIHRLFNLEKLSIETAGGRNEAEAELLAVRPADIDLVEKAINSRYGDDDLTDTSMSESMSAGEADDHPQVAAESDKHSQSADAHWELSMARLFVAGLTSGKIGVILALVGAAYSQLGQVIPDSWYETVGHRLIASGLMVIMFLVVAVILLSWLFSILGTVFVYWKFTISKYGDDLVITSGLWNRKQVTLPIHRIQAVRVVDSLLQQPLGFSAIYVESAGGSGNEGGSTMMFPILPMAQVGDFVQTFLPAYPEMSQFESVPRRAKRFYLVLKIIFTTVICAAIMILSYIWFWPWGLLTLVLYPVVIVWGLAQYKTAAWGVTDRFRLLRYRHLSRTTVMVPRYKIQTRTMEQTIFQKRAGVATYQLSVMSKMAGGGRVFEVEHLAEDEVREALRRS